MVFTKNVAPIDGLDRASPKTHTGALSTNTDAAMSLFEVEDNDPARSR
jgi:hypothetical protein